MPFSTWKKSIRYAFRKLGVTEDEEIHWQTRYVTYFHGQVIQQHDAYNCGPIACMVLWGLINPTSRYFQDSWGNFQITVPSFRRKVIEYINTQMGTAHTLFSVRQVETVTCLDGASKGKEKRKSENITYLNCSEEEVDVDGDGDDADDDDDDDDNEDDNDDKGDDHNNYDVGGIVRIATERRIKKMKTSPSNTDEVTDAKN